MKKIVIFFSFLLIFIGFNEIKACDTTWNIGCNQFSYGSCVISVNYIFHLNAKCEVEYQITEFFASDTSCYDLLAHNSREIWTVVNDEVWNSVISSYPIPPCDDNNPPQVVWSISYLASCSRLVGYIDHITKVNCPNSLTCIKKYTHCKELTPYGYYKIITTLVETITVSGNSCFEPIQYINWFDSNGNFFENPWSCPNLVAWPVTTSCYNYDNGCE